MKNKYDGSVHCTNRRVRKFRCFVPYGSSIVTGSISCIVLPEFVYASDKNLSSFPAMVKGKSETWKNNGFILLVGLIYICSLVFKNGLQFLFKVVFLAKKTGLPIRDLSMPFSQIKNLELKQPMFGNNYITGTLVAAPGGSLLFYSIYILIVVWMQCAIIF